MAGDVYDVIVIGAGPTGENVADRAVRGGLSAVVVESELVGGECSYWACMPSKALLRPVGAVAEAGAVRGVTGARLEPAEVLARRDAFAHDWKDDGQVEWLNGAKISLVRGPGRLAGERLVSVGDVTLAWAPMLWEERGVGSICAMRQPPSPFTDTELALLVSQIESSTLSTDLALRLGEHGLRDDRQCGRQRQRRRPRRDADAAERHDDTPPVTRRCNASAGERRGVV